MPRSRNSIRRVPRRKRQWASTLTSGTSIASTGTVILDLMGEWETAVGHEAYAVTTQRFIGNFSINTAAGSSPGDLGVVSIGIAIIDKDQVNVPDPNTDHFDWLYVTHRPVVVHADQPASFPYPGIYGDVVLDIQSARRLSDPHKKLVLIGAHDGALGSNPTLVGGIRTLFLLP